MKLLTLALGTSLIIAVPSMAAPDFKGDPFSRKEYYKSKPITGRVTNEKGEPLSGVTVQVKGLKTSTVTNADGVFTLDVPSDAATLVFTYVGMDRKEVSIAGKTDFQIQLKGTETSLTDVVVVGYAVQKKESLTGSITSIKASEVEDLPVGNLGAALQGRLLGVGVSGGTGRPGSQAVITVRNPATFSKDGGTLDPLYVIDGVIQVTPDGKNDASRFNSLDPSEVESISVLKDATAAVYGSRGASGVVIVTTKRGKAGAPRVSYSGSYAINDEAYRTKMMNAEQFAWYMNIMNGVHGAKALTTDMNAFFSNDEIQRFRNINYDWLEPAWKASSNMRHTLNVSGGTDKATFFASGTYYGQDGNLATLDYKKWTFRAGADATVATGLKTGIQVFGNYGNRVKTFNKIGGENDENDYRNLLLTPRFVPMYNGMYPVKVPGTDALSNYHFYEIQRLGNVAEADEKSLGVNAYVEYEIPFVKGLKARGSYARNFSHSIGSQIGSKYNLYTFTPTGAFGHILDSGAVVRMPASSIDNGNRIYYSNTNAENSQSNFSLNYARQFGAHNVSAMAIVERGEAENLQTDVWKESPMENTNGQFNTAFGSIDGRTSGNESGTLGYIGRVNYSYADKYLGEFLYRSDASTRFAPDNYWGSFYSASAGWVISKENFFNVPAVNFLKIRYSMGILGKDDTKAWQWRQRFTPQFDKGAVFGGNNNVTTGIKMEASPNSDAHWSKDFKNNLGIDAQFLKNRLSLTLEGFYNHSTEMLLERTEAAPLTVGGTLAAENFGRMDFFGYEASVGWGDNIGRDFRYGIDVRFSWYDNMWLQGNFGALDKWQPWKNSPGKSADIGQWGYDYLGMFKSQGDIDAYVSKYNIKSVFGTAVKDLRPGMLYYSDVRGALIQQADGTYAFEGPDGIINENDQIQLTEKASNHYGISSTIKLGWKGISFDAVISGSFGGWAEIDGTSRKKMNNNISRNFQSRPVYWANIYDSTLNPTGDMPNPHWDAISLSPTSNFWKVSAFRLAIRNANLNYSLPKKYAQAIRVSNVRVALTALNPLYLYNPYNYKAPDGAYDVFPDLRTFSAGINITL